MFGESDKKKPTKHKRDAKIALFRSGKFTSEELGILSLYDTGENDEESETNYPWGVTEHMQLYIIEKHRKMNQNVDKKEEAVDETKKVEDEYKKSIEELNQREFGMMEIDGQKMSVFDYVKGVKNQS